MIQMIILMQLIIMNKMKTILIKILMIKILVNLIKIIIYLQLKVIMKYSKKKRNLIKKMKKKTIALKDLINQTKE